MENGNENNRNKRRTGEEMEQTITKFIDRLKAQFGDEKASQIVRFPSWLDQIAEERKEKFPTQIAQVEKKNECTLSIEHNENTDC